MALFSDRYRIESTRLPYWDYRDGWYFVTICTGERVPWFGKIVGGRMRLTRIGYLIEREWRRTARLRRNVGLDAFVVMPDHFHGIIWLEKETPQRGVSTLPNAMVNHWKPGSLATIINQFKSACTKRIWAMGCPNFQWQSRFHDRIIRDERELQVKREYVRRNPRLPYA